MRHWLVAFTFCVGISGWGLSFLPYAALALDANATCGLVSCAANTQLTEQERNEFSQINATELPRWHLRQMGRAADSYEALVRSLPQVSERERRTRIERCLTEVRSLSSSGDSCLRNLDSELSNLPQIQQQVRALHHSAMVSLYAANYCSYHRHTSTELDQICSERILTPAGARQELAHYLRAADAEARGPTQSGQTTGTGSGARSGASSPGARFGSSPGTPPREPTRTIRPVAGPTSARSTTPRSARLIQQTGSRPGLSSPLDRECSEPNFSCSLSDLRADSAQSNYLPSGIHGQCLRQYSCRLSQWGGGSSLLLNQALSPQAFANEAMIEQLLEERRNQLRLRLLEKLITQWSAMSAAQARIGCNIAQFRSEARAALQQCGDGGGGFSQGVSQILTRYVNSEEAQTQFRSICERAQSALGERQVQAQAQALRSARCAEKYFNEVPFANATALAAAQAAWREQSVNTGDVRSHHRSIAPEQRQAEFIRTFERECGPNSFASASSRVGSLIANLGADQARIHLEDEIACRTQDAPAGLEHLSLSELGTRATTDRRNINLFQASDQRRVSIRQTYGEIEAFQAVKQAIRGACARQANDPEALNLPTLEAFVGREAPATDLASALPSLSRPGGGVWNPYSEILSCTESSRQSTGTAGLMRSLATSCDAVMAATLIPGSQPLSLPLNALCVVPQIGSAYEAEGRHQELLTLRRALGGRLGCDTAPEIFRRLSDASTQVNQALLQSALQAGFTGLDILSIISRSHAATVAAREEVLQRAIQNCPTSGCAPSRATVTATLPDTLPAAAPAGAAEIPRPRDPSSFPSFEFPNPNAPRPRAEPAATVPARPDQIAPPVDLARTVPQARPEVRINLPGCCEAVPTVAAEPVIRVGNHRLDPYFTGSGRRPTPQPGRRFQIGLPDRLTANTRGVGPITLREAPPVQVLEDELRALGIDPATQSTRAGEGGLSVASFIHPPIPPELEARWVASHGTGTPGYREARARWAAENATDVIKVRKTRIFGQNDPTVAARYLQRDAVMGEIADQLLSSARYDGQPLVEVARWRSTPGEISRGIVRQAPVRGPSAAHLHDAATTVLELGSRPATQLTAAEQSSYLAARNLLQQAGLRANEALDRLGALEAAYRAAHSNARRFAQVNRLDSLANYGSPVDGIPNNLINIGLDYNHGQNVIWDSRRRIFQVVDW